MPKSAKVHINSPTTPDTEYKNTSPKAQTFTNQALAHDRPVYTGSALLKIKDKRIKQIIQLESNSNNSNDLDKRDGIFAFNVSQSAGSKSGSLIKPEL
jgi:hypothetical protein